MISTNHPQSEILHTLNQLALQICQRVQDLSTHSALLDPEQLTHISESAQAVKAGVDTSAGATLDNKETRHDIRNQLAVIRGFSDLLQLENPPSHPATPILEDLISYCDEMVTSLDALTEASGDHKVQDPFAN